MNILDIVNEEDEVVGFEDRKVIHAQGLLHREVHVWFLDENNNVFFQKRGLSKSHPGLLDASVGGHVDKNENYEQAAIREVEEEVGIKIKKEDLIFLKKFHDYYKNKDKINNFYRSIYVYKLTVSDLKTEESSNQNGGFEKISLKDLMKVTKDRESRFLKFILEDEIPTLLEYIKSK